MPIARYLTHPQVVVAPDMPVPDWHLNETGHARVAALTRSAALRGTNRVYSSAETKAIETAEPLAQMLGCSVTIRDGMHENDRSSTGFLPPDAFEAMADRFFGHPEQSAEGWERAVDAQARILGEVETALGFHSDGDVLFVGHGGVGTLLYCALAALPISRDHDQGPGGGGNFFAFALADRRPQSRWQPMEALLAP